MLVTLILVVSEELVVSMVVIGVELLNIVLSVVSEAEVFVVITFVLEIVEYIEVLAMLVLLVVESLKVVALEAFVVKLLILDVKLVELEVELEVKLELVLELQSVVLLKVVFVIGVLLVMLEFVVDEELELKIVVDSLK